MAINTMQGLVPEWFTPAAEKEDERPSEFLITPLTGPQVASLQLEFDPATGAISVRGLVEAARLGVTDWRNVNDANGAPSKFTKRGVDTLPYLILIELGGEVISRSIVTDEDAKNL